MVTKRLIVGLGNPGLEYDKTRHNLGFRVVEKLAKLHGVQFVKEKSFPGLHGKFKTDQHEVHFLMPLTYMNESGQAMWRCLEYYKVNFQGLLVIADDIAIPYGSLRLRPHGTSGGHNGLKSIEEWLGTNRYSRLRLGIGQPENEVLKKFVLDDLTSSEELKWPMVEESAIELVNEWLKDPTLSKSKALE